MNRTIWVSSSADLGGGELSLGRYLRTRGATEELWCFEDGRLVSEARDAGCSVTVFGRGLWHGLPTFSAFHRFRSLLLNLDRSDLVIANSVQAGRILGATSNSTQAQCIYYLREDMTMSWLPAWRRRIRGFLLSRFSGYICNSEWTRSTLLPNMSAQPCWVAYPVSGIDSDWVSSSPYNGRLTGGALRLLTLSRVTEKKGIALCVEAAGIIKKAFPYVNLRLTIAGRLLSEDFSYFGRLMERARSLYVGIDYVGLVDDVRKLLIGCDAVVVPTLNAEPFGQVVVQGMAAGVVTIVPDHGGPAELVADRDTGLLFHSGDRESLASCFQWMLDNVHSWSAMGTRARSAVTPFLDDRTTTDLSSVIGEIRERLCGSVSVVEAR